MLKALSLLAASELGGALTRRLRAVPYFAVGALLFLFGFWFLLDLAHTWLTMRMSSMAASGALAAALLVLAGVLFAVGYSVKERPRTAASPLTTSALVAAPFAARFLGKRLRFGTVAVAGVVAAGAILGRYVGRS